MALFHRLVIRDGPMPMRLARLLAAALAMSSAATLIMAVASAIEAGSLGAYLFGSRNGLLQIARAGVADAGALLLLFGPRRLADAVAGATGLIGIALLVAAGHAAAFADPVPLLAGIIHVAAAAIWIGGIAGLLLLLLRPELVVDGRPPELRRCVPRFSALALVAIGLVGVTGVYNAWIETGALLPAGTEYGRTLIMKSALAIGAFGLGGLNFLDGGRMKPWLDGFRTRLSVEGMTAAAVLVMTAALATTPPVDEVRGVPITPVPDAFGEIAPQLRMQVLPGRPGVNRIVVTTSDALVSSDLSLALDRLDTGTSSSVPLVARGLEGMGGMEGMDHGSIVTRNDDGTVDWIADAVVLPAGSSWETAVEVRSSSGEELSRQRFSFALSDDRISEGRLVNLLNPGSGLAILLVVGGALGLGLGIGGMPLPRCDAAASRVALIGGGTVGALLGVLIGLQALMG
jgi:putative copper export protein